MRINPPNLLGKTSRLLSFALLVAAFAVGSPASPARADSGVFQLHADLGIGAPLFGGAHRNSTLRTSAHRNDSAIGGLLFLGADYQFSRPLAVELMFGIGGFARPYDGTGKQGTRYLSLTAGLRWRILDDDAGYNNEASGNIGSNWWASLHVGYHQFDGNQFGVDLATGYEFSVVRPLQLGVFVRSALTFGDQFPDQAHTGADLMLVGGLSVSIEIIRTPGPRDSDGDGINDDREAELGTSPTNSDSDGDGLPDGLEVETGTNPVENDTDGDGLRDGREDENLNGVLDDGETDPRQVDTDGGGMPDGDEVRMAGQDPRYREDDDRDSDGVNNSIDECPDTPNGQEVDGVGCQALQERMTFEGINFATGSATIESSSEPVLQQALQVLQRNSSVRVEVGGHTDDRGSARNNQRLSQRRAEAVRRWLIENGIDAARLEARGYGPDQPIESNETEEGRAHNRRIEFRRLH